MIEGGIAFVAEETRVEHHHERDKEDEAGNEYWSAVLYGDADRDEDNEEDTTEEHQLRGAAHAFATRRVLRYWWCFDFRLLLLCGRGTHRHAPLPPPPRQAP